MQGPNLRLCIRYTTLTTVMRWMRSCQWIALTLKKPLNKLYAAFTSQFLQHIPIGGSITQVLDGYAPPVLGTSERLECLTLFLCQRSVSVRDTVWVPYRAVILSQVTRWPESGKFQVKSSQALQVTRTTIPIEYSKITTILNTCEFCLCVKNSMESLKTWVDPKTWVMSSISSSQVRVV